MAGVYWFIDRLDKGPKAEWQELVVIMAGVFYKSTASLFTKVNAGIDYLCYNGNMKKERISLTNPYLRDRAQRQLALVASVSSSSAIEGITGVNEYLRQVTSCQQDKNCFLPVVAESKKASAEPAW